MDNYHKAIEMFVGDEYMSRSTRKENAIRIIELVCGDAMIYDSDKADILGKVLEAYCEGCNL